VLGATVKKTEPVSRQVFIGRGPTIRDEAHFERKLYICRKVVSNRVKEVLGAAARAYYPCLGLDPHHRLQGFGAGRHA
jgi:glutamate synthase (NADPH) large chain